MKPITNNFLFLSVFSLQNYSNPFCLVFFLNYVFNISGLHCMKRGYCGLGRCQNFVTSKIDRSSVFGWITSLDTCAFHYVQSFLLSLGRSHHSYHYRFVIFFLRVFSLQPWSSSYRRHAAMVCSAIVVKWRNTWTIIVTPHLHSHSPV